MRSRGKYFIIQVESRCTDGVVMLDVEFKKDAEWERTGRLSFYSYAKPSSIYAPLLPSSAHPWHCHLAWPQALCWRFRALSCTRRAARSRVELFANEYTCAFGVPLTLDVGPKARRPNQCSSAAVSYLVLPYYKEWERARFQKVLDKARELHPAPGLDATRIAFKLSGKHMVHVLTGFNRAGSTAMSVVT